MLVCVTGGTGFVGSHTVAAITAAGHRVRVIARDPAAVARVLRPLGVADGAVEAVPGDVTDAVSVAGAVSGADAVVHAAAVYSFDSRRRADMRRVNALGTETVLTAARRAGVPRIVHVSSVGALFPSRRTPIDGDSPVGRPRETYLATKAEAEAVARRHQREHPGLLISYPPALLGPHDPRSGDQTSRLRATLRGLMPVWPTGGFPLGDVRDTAALHADLATAPSADLVVDPRDGARRWFGPGHYVPTTEYVRALRQVTGRRLPAVFLPAAAVLPVGVAADALRRVWPWPIPAEYGAVYTCWCATRVAEHARTRGGPPRPLIETVADTVRWLRREGRLTAHQAGDAQ